MIKSKDILQKKLRASFSYILLFTLGFFFASCSDISNSADSHSDGKKALVTLSASCTRAVASTITPDDMSEGDVTKITFSAKDSEGAAYVLNDEGATELSWDSLYSMRAASFSMDIGTYTFTLKLYTGQGGTRLTQSGSLEKEIIAGENLLSFNTEYVDKGDLSVSFSWNEALAENVKTVEAALYTLGSDSQPVSLSDEDICDFTVLSIISDEESGESKYSALYNLSDIPNGSYLLKYRFYDQYGTNILNTISRVVKIKGYKTECSITVSQDDLNKLSSETGSIEIADNQIMINADIPETLYLNGNSIPIYALDPAGDAIDADNIGISLVYGNQEISSEYYSFSDGVLKIGQNSDGETCPLLCGGSYTLNVTASADVGSTPVTASAAFNLKVIEKEYYKFSIEGAEGAEDLKVGISAAVSAMRNDALIVISGNPNDNEGAGFASGYFSAISEALSESKLHKIDLDMSGTGANLKMMNSNDGFRNVEMLNSVRLSRYVLSIDYGAFSYLTGLTLVTLDDEGLYLDESKSQPRLIAGGAFYRCSALEKFEINNIGEGGVYTTLLDGKILLGPGTETVDGVSVGKKIVAASPLVTELDLSDTSLFPGATDETSENFINEIGSYAFEKSALTKIAGLSCITRLGEMAFAYCSSLESVVLDTLPSVVGSYTPFYSAKVKELTVNFAVTNDNYADFEILISPLDGNGIRCGMSGLEKLVFNESLYLSDVPSGSAPSDYTASSASLFYYSSDTLTSLALNGGGTIGDYQFTNYSNIAEITLPSDGVADKDLVLGSKVFAGTAVTTLDFTNVSEIKNPYYAFQYCDSLASITIGGTNTVYETDSSKKILIQKEDGVKTAVGVIPSITGANFNGTGVTKIAKQAFWVAGMYTFTNLNLTGVEHVGMQAFYNLTALEEIEWGTTLKSIDRLAFYRCGVTEINLPESVIAISKGAFTRMSNETEKTLTIGYIDAESENQPTGWYRLTGDDAASTWQSWIDSKPSSDELVSTGNLTVTSLPEEGSTETVITTIQSAACDTTSAAGEGYYYRLTE